MLNFEDILKVYPKRLHAFKENILKEYLQHKIIDILFSNNLASKLVFLGGTATRIIHNSIRFSEDLDFDNLGLSPSDFTKIPQQIKYQLELALNQLCHCQPKTQDILNRRHTRP